MVQKCPEKFLRSPSGAQDERLLHLLRSKPNVLDVGWILQPRGGIRILAWVLDPRHGGTLKRCSNRPACSPLAALLEARL